MSRRRLSRQQQARINARQDVHRERAGAADQSSTDSLGSEQTGLVISHHGRSVIIEDSRGELIRCTVRQNIGTPVSGDRVAWQSSGEKGVVIAVMERRSLLTRPDSRGGSRPYAANLDQIVVVAAIKPDLSDYLIDRYLVTAEAVGIRPIIVVNKSDLLDSKHAGVVRERVEAYRVLGYETLFTCAKDPEHGLETLIPFLRGRASILVGQSGVGKSSLIKALLPERDIRIGQLSEAQHGKHTTTTSVLYHLPFGGDLIDSPGVRDFGLWHLSPEQIIDGFIEFRPYRGQCKFSNCAHISEPGCALLGAVSAGEIQARRLASYQQMVRDLEERGR